MTIVRGQHVDPVKVQRSRELRRQMTREESLLWTALRANKLAAYHFRRQQLIAGFIADFYCHAARLVVEVDGFVHQGRAEYNAERDAILAAHGLRIIRISNEEVQHNLAGVLARIAEVCDRLTAIRSERSH